MKNKPSILIPPIVYTLILMAGSALACLLPGTSCRLGESPTASLAFLFLGVIIAAYLIHFCIGYPFFKLLVRMNLNRSWILLLLSVIVGLTPLLILCMTGNCIDVWNEYVICGFAGLGAGASFLLLRSMAGEH